MSDDTVAPVPFEPAAEGESLTERLIREAAATPTPALRPLRAVTAEGMAELDAQAEAAAASLEDEPETATLPPEEPGADREPRARELITVALAALSTTAGTAAAATVSLTAALATLSAFAGLLMLLLVILG